MMIKEQKDDSGSVSLPFGKQTVGRSAVEYILCAAIWYQDGNQYPHQPKNIETGIVICGRRHHNCITTRSVTTIDRLCQNVQGFLTSKDRFLNRKEAYQIALAVGQVAARKADKYLDQYFGTKPGDTDILISEDLYSEDVW
jgi:hypothetical protein